MNPSPGVVYKITRVVGQGAFGTVYEGERLGQGLSRRVAMKLLNAMFSGHGAIEGRLRDEARMLALIRHRAIVRVEDLIQVDDAWCVVMEFVDGADLGQLLGLGPIPPRAALQIAEEVASALHAAHTQIGPEGSPLRLVHRDIKPQNIRLTPQGEVKLLDFGIAKAEFVGREANTGTPGMGTVVYMAPERFRGEDTTAGDVYALGVTLFELLTGVPPGASAADPDRHSPGTDLRDKWAWLQGLEPGVLSLLEGMMANAPGDRPSARDCARRLAELRIRVPGDLLEDWGEGAIRTLGVSHPAPSPILPTPANATLHVGQTLDAPRDGHFVSGPAPRPSEPPPPSIPPSAPVEHSGWPWRLALVAGVALVTAAAWWLGAQGAFPPPAVADHGVDAPELRRADPATPPASPVAPQEPLPVVGADPPEEHAVVPLAEPDQAPATPAPARRTSTPTRPTGTIHVSGATSVTLHGPGGDTPPGEVAPGTYTASVRFPDGNQITVHGIQVGSGQRAEVRCDASFASCVVSPAK